MTTHLRRFAAFIVAASLAASGCTESAGEEELLVSAAASLTDAFNGMALAYEAARPGIDVRLNLAGSAALREQLLSGAPADVFASADEATMAPVVEAGLTDGDPAAFALNRLVIAVPAGNLAGVSGLADFADADLLLGLCADGVPCGTLARAVLDRAGIDPAVDTNEPDVRSLLTKIEADELDAGIVYVTDAAAAGDGVEAITIPDDANLTTVYPIAALQSATDLPRARDFVAFVRSERGREILARHGFGVP
jgi:molybdate transport system substrate-binding protein